MKKLIIFSIICCVNLAVFAQTKKMAKNQENTLEETLQKTDKQTSTFDQQYIDYITTASKDIENKFNNHISRVDHERDTLFTFITILIAIAGILTPLFSYILSKVLAKQIYKNISNEISVEPDALIKTLNHKSIEISLKKEYKFLLIYNGDYEEHADAMLELLKTFGFKKSSLLSKEEINETHEKENRKFNKNDIFILFDDTKTQYKEDDEKPTKFSKWLKEDISEYIWSLHKTCGYFFINDENLLHNFKEKKISCFGACNSGSTLYNNLISLLHYKRHLVMGKPDPFEDI